MLFAKDVKKLALPGCSESTKWTMGPSCENEISLGITRQSQELMAKS
jgi:hypothetical protein